LVVGLTKLFRFTVTAGQTLAIVVAVSEGAVGGAVSTVTVTGVLVAVQPEAVLVAVTV
jgi:hypothetical protein